MEKFRAESRQGIAKAFAEAISEKGGDHDIALLVALYFSDEKFRAALHEFSWKLCETGREGPTRRRKKNEV